MAETKEMARVQVVPLDVPNHLPKYWHAFRITLYMKLMFKGFQYWNWADLSVMRHYNSCLWMASGILHDWDHWPNMVSILVLASF